MSSVESAVLHALAGSDGVMTDALAATLGVAHQDVVGAAMSLEADGYVSSELQTAQVWKPTEEGLTISREGSPEYLLWKILSERERSQEEVAEQFGVGRTGVAMSNALKRKIVKVRKEDGKVLLSRSSTAEQLEDNTQLQLMALLRGEPGNAADMDALKKRKLVTLEKIKTFKLSKGAQYATERRSKAVGDLTKEMLQDGSWKTTEFKAYNFTAGHDVDGGYLHPLLKVRQEFRQIFSELGFQEMMTQNWVESSFWNFDSLLIPQQHPARDSQDTFFISAPSSTTEDRRDYVDRVKARHEECFSTPWKEDEASRNVLRTHTTASSAFTLYNLAQNAPRSSDGKLMFTPGRYYSIDRVFRNEEMDRTHLCEFHQIEGFVIDRNISLANMMHTLHSFFQRIGIEKLRFKPAFNPYTEPSMEIFGYHKELKRWMEVGNSGLFRPELLEPMGFDSSVSVMAWGLSLERPTMIKYGLSSIHELFGHKVDLNFVRKAAVAKF